MKHFIGVESPSPVSSHGSGPRLRRPAAWLFVLLVAFGVIATAVPASACVEPPQPRIGIWILIDGNQFWIKVRRYVTFGVTAGTYCSCGLQMMPSIAGIDSAILVNRTTQEPLSQFSFSFNSTTSTGLAQAAGGGTWTGFLSPTTADVPAGISVDLVFHGTLVPGTTFGDLRDELLEAGDVIGTAESNEEGEFLEAHRHIPIVAVVDRAPPGSTPPSGIATPMSGATVGVIFQDDDDGLRHVRILDTVNARAEVPSFDRDTTDPVTVAVSLVDEGLSGFVSIEACNSHGRCIVYDPIVTSLDLTATRVAVARLEDLSGRRSHFQVMNGEPGLRYFSLLANGRSFSIHPLRRGQILDLDASLAMVEEGNSIRLAGRGQPGARAVVLIGD